DITPEALAHEIERAVGAALVHLAPSTNVSIRVGKSSMTAEQVAANVDAVVNVLTEKYIPKGWRNIRSLHVKGPNTAALPIWLADELWTDEADVLESLPAPVVKDKKKRKRALLETGAVDTAETDDSKSAKKSKSEGASDETKAKKSKSDNAEKAARKAALKKQKEESKTAIAA
ncbi:hypothetical protein KCU66_g20016, partial [Aureobasidium melanogenum]